MNKVNIEPYNYEANTLYFDVEKTPTKGFSYRSWKSNLFDIEEDWFFQSIAWTWGNSPKIQVATLPDFKLYKTEPHNDRELVKVIYEEFKKAHVIVGHNIKKFDIPMTKHRFIHHGLPPLPKLEIRDTLCMAKRYGFISNSLDNVSRELGVGRKIECGVKELWKECYDGDMRAWKLFAKYNKHDVYLTRKIDRALSAWEDTFPKVRLSNDFCTRCGSRPNEWKCNGKKYYRHYFKQRYACLRCGFPNLYSDPMLCE